MKVEWAFLHLKIKFITDFESNLAVVK
jgi:hypothetical protein